MFQEQKPRTKKIKVPRVVDGVETYVEIEVPDTGSAGWGPNTAHAVLNHAVRRVDGPEKSSGTAKYASDVRPEGMLFGRILRSPHASAEVLSVDTGPAEKIPGVKAVYVSTEKKFVKFEGDPVAAVAAVSPEIAEDGIRAIRVQYRKLPHVVTPDEAIRPDAPAVFKGAEADSLKGNLRPIASSGDRAAAEAALAGCAVLVEREFRITMQHHVCLETHGQTVDFRGGESATIYASTQGTFTIPGECASRLGLKASQIKAVVEYMGGGFGSKFGPGIEGHMACELSKRARAPVKLMLTRVDEFLVAGNRSGAWQRVRAGATQDGTLTAMVVEQYMLGGVGQGSQADLPYIYGCKTVYRQKSALHTHQDSSRAMRGPGHPQASFAMESLMDDLADALGMDPVEFRKKNAIDPAYSRQLDRGAEVIGWKNRPKKPGAGPAYGPYKSLKRGMGCGLATWGGGGGPSCQVDVAVKQDGSVSVQVGTQDLGTGSRTYTAAIVAEEFGLKVPEIETRIGSSTYGMANASGGSTTTASLAPAVKDAAAGARILLFEKIAPMLGVKAEELTAQDGKIYPISAPDKALSWKQACATLGASGISARGVWKPGYSAGGVHGAQFAEVEVDLETGAVRVLKMVGVQDCGLPLNRLAVESQINGGMIQALGYALLEQTVVDAATGHMLNATMDEYKLPGCLEIPEMIPIIDDGDTRDKVIGMAEPAAIPGASAIANAVFNACGVRVTSLPITPDKILDGLAKRRQA